MKDSPKTVHNPLHI